MYGNQNGYGFQREDLGPGLITAGLSMLANNDGRMNTAQLIGQGGLDALAGLQLRKQMEAERARQAEMDARAAEEWQWKQDDRAQQAALRERFAAGDPEAFRILYPEQYYMNERQKKAQEHAIKVLQLSKAMQGGPVFSPIQQTSPTVPGSMPTVPSSPAKPASNASPSMTPGKVYDFDGNEMQGNGAVKWGKREEIILSDGRKVIGQLDPTGNVFRYGGDVEGKRLPLSAVNNITANSSMLGRIRGAGEEARKNPDATGPLKGFANDWMPDAVLQWFDSDGTVSRAKIAELGSQVIHDRSGAAVTASEFPRLKPFIPQIGDTPDTVQKKLQQFYAIVQEEYLLYLESLKESGYSVPNSLFERGMKPFDDTPPLPDGFVED